MMGMHPSLRGAVERLSREGVEVTIRAGRDTTPPMPSFEGQLADEDIDAVIAYLDALPVGSRNFGPEADGGMMDDGMMGGRIWTWLGSALFLLLVAAIVVGSILLLRRMRGQPSSQETALEILQQRFARGEIDRDEFEERRRALGE